jgi:hypothetical protein
LLGTGYRYGYPAGYKLTEMECALALAKVMLSDLTLANTTGWQWWTTFEKGKHSGEARYCLIEAFTKNDNSDGVYHLNKLFYTFGNFSHFIRPGMVRLAISRSDNLSDFQAISDLMFAAFSSADEKELVLVAANFNNEARELNLDLKNITDKKLANQVVYLTDAFTNLSKQDVDWTSEKVIVPAKSVITYSAELTDVTGFRNEKTESGNMNAFYRDSYQDIRVRFNNTATFQTVRLFDITGKLLYSNSLKGNHEISISTQYLEKGIYIVTANGQNTIESKKVMIK